MSESFSLQVIDSHTGGEPTRILVSGGPKLIGATLQEQKEHFHREYDHLRSAIVNEPRGSDVLVGAMLCEPVSDESVAGVIFFNNVGMLNMCGHGTIGLAVTLAHMGMIEPGTHQVDTPVGPVRVELESSSQATIENVPSYRFRKAVRVEIPGHGHVTGDIAWGGNWFFLVHDHQQQLDISNTETLTNFSWKIRQALQREGITGEHGGVIDHIELFGPPGEFDAESRNFVLCPGKAYDRSPCGTGTSAKLACLYADGKLKPGDIYRQASILGSVFEGRISLDGSKVVPKITGQAYVTGEAKLIFHPDDPFAYGIK